MSESIIKCEGLNKWYGSIQALKDVSIDIKKGEAVGLVGDNGAGKSTFIKILSGVHKADSGKIYFNGNLIKNHFELLKDDIGIIFQDHYLISELNIFDNIKLKSNDTTKIENILDYFEMTDFKLKYPNQLSNGQKQRVCVARSLVNNPKLLIADEPTSYLDKENAKLVIDLILNSSKKFNLSTIIASHDISFRPLFDKSYTLDNKSIKEC